MHDDFILPGLRVTTPAPRWQLGCWRGADIESRSTGVWLACPRPAPWFPVLSQPLGASGCPQVTLNRTRAPAMPAAHLRCPAFVPASTLSLTATAHSHESPPACHLGNMASASIPSSSCGPAAGRERGFPGPPQAARVHSGRLLLSSCPRSPWPGVRSPARGQGQEGELGKTLSLLALTLLPAAAALGSQDTVQTALGPTGPDTPLPGIGRRHSRWVCVGHGCASPQDTTVFPRDVIPASGRTILW